ncbi:hypothetical protein F4561_002498 [Lipingzhangella halophila]|uniref:DUF4386 family protein n=1 Tax=Lipingzhangella halophila TaxID=1783352 RepID=A0A7W7W2Q4_9ACTN|nr:hypothetical protein [Lipingzhangella halophila]MBB4931678.1 hypothetical protein [Lipingzhangella halophila]
MASRAAPAPRTTVRTPRWAAVGLVLGTVCYIVPTIVHGNPPVESAEGTLRWVADRPSWRIMHMLNIAAILLWAVSLGALHPPKAPDPVKQATRTITTIAAAVFATYFSLHAMALSVAADRFTTGEVPRAEVLAQTEAVLLVLGAVAFTAQALLGLAILLNGLTLATGGQYPRWLGGTAVVAGAGWMIGALLVDIDRIVVPFTALTWIWTFVMAIAVWRYTANAGTVEPEPGAGEGAG